MAGLLSLVTFGEAIAYHVILFGQDPQVCSGYVRAESRWTTTAPSIARHKARQVQNVE
jgi:hypothetical protein